MRLISILPNIAAIIAGLILLWPATAPATDSEKYVPHFKCRIAAHCRGEGAFVAEKFARKSRVEVSVYDIRPSRALPGYFHVSLISGEKAPIQIVVTNAEYLVPTLINVSPARLHDPSSRKYKPPVNVFFVEEDGMYVARPRLKEALLLGRGSNQRYILIVDSLWKDELAQLVELINEKFRDGKNPPSLYLVPVFGMFSTRTAELGRYFYALIDLGVDPLLVAYNFSRAGHEIKGFPGPLFQLSLSLLQKRFPEEKEEKLKARLRVKLARISAQKAVERSAEMASKVGVIMLKSVLLYDDRIYHYPDLLGIFDVSFKEYFAKKLFGGV